MPHYVVLFPADNEPEWEAATEAERQVTFDTDFEFGQRLAARGGKVTGGAGLTDSKHARTLRPGADSDALVTEGPFRPGAEQLTGFFLVTCDDYDALVEAAEVLVKVHPVVEIRPVNEF
ncbi:transcription initiation protein [Terrabacter sp. NPDC080008]|uniref:YciI family protein n=1 Tax=Terrabacter sp. NPDC080008 TaxID=3155176 RepID=UPI00344C9461